MGIVSRIFDSMNGVYWFPVIAFAIFAIFFILVAIHTFSIDKSKEKECGALPFENDEKYQSDEM